MEKVKEIILRILEIVGYLDDKSVFAEKFVNLCASRTITDLISELPSVEKSHLLEKMKDVEKLEDRVRLAKSYFKQKEIDIRFKSITGQLIDEYLIYIKTDPNRL